MAMRRSFSPANITSAEGTSASIIQNQLQLNKEENLKLKQKLLQLSNNLSRTNTQNTDMKVRLMDTEKDTHRLLTNLENECDFELNQVNSNFTAKLREYQKKLKIHQIVRKQQLIEIKNLVEEEAQIKTQLQACQGLVRNENQNQSYRQLDVELQIKYNELEILFEDNKKLREQNEMLNEYILNMPHLAEEISSNSSQVLADIQEAFVDLSSLMQLVMTGQTVCHPNAIKYRNALESLQNNMEMLTNKIYDVNQLISHA